MAKQSRKERAELQKQQQQPSVKKAEVQSPKKRTSASPGGNSLIKGLNIILILIAFALNVNTLGHDYALDDYGLILENSQTKGGISSVGTILKSSYRDGSLSPDFQLYRPLSKAMFAIEWSIAPKSPGFNHFVNVLLLALTGVLLFKVLRAFFREQVLLPFLTACLFIIHPIHTEVVANIKGRDEILVFFFFLATAWYAFQWMKSGKPKHMYLTGAMFFLCFLSKESAITFLAALPLMFYFFTDAPKKFYVRLASVLGVVTGVFLLIRMVVLHGGMQPVPEIDNYIVGIDGFLSQRATAVYILGIYLIKLFVPWPLISDMSIQQLPVVTFGDWTFWLSFLVFLCAGVFALMEFRKRTVASFAILFFFITISVGSNIPFILGTNYGERLLYTPSLAISLLVAWAATRFIQKTEGSGTTAMEFIRANSKAAGFAGALVVVYGFITINRNAEWKDNVVLFSTDIAKAPKSAKLRFYYANHITQADYLKQFKEGSPERNQIIDTALHHFRIAVDLYPNYGDALQKMAEMFYEKKMLDSSEIFYKKAITAAPANAIYRNNYGRLLFTQGKLEEARIEFEAALRFNAGYAHAMNNLSSVYGTYGSNYVVQAQTDSLHRDSLYAAARKNFETSLEWSIKATQYDPNYVQAFETTAITYGNLGDQQNKQKYLNLAEEARRRSE